MPGACCQHDAGMSTHEKGSGHAAHSKPPRPVHISTTLETPNAYDLCAVLCCGCLLCRSPSLCRSPGTASRRCSRSCMGPVSAGRGSGPHHSCASSEVRSLAASDSTGGWGKSRKLALKVNHSCQLTGTTASVPTHSQWCQSRTLLCVCVMFVSSQCCQDMVNKDGVTCCQEGDLPAEFSEPVHVTDIA